MALPHLKELKERRTIFFQLRGVLSVIVVTLLLFHHGLVSWELWLLGTAFLGSSLLTLSLPGSCFQSPKTSYLLFFLDMGVLTVILHFLTGIFSGSLLLYYLTIFMATLGEDVWKSVGTAFVTAAIYTFLHLSRGGRVLDDPEILVPIPLFFATAIYCGYLAQQLRGHERQVRKLKDIEEGLQEELDQFFTLSLDLFCIADFNGHFKSLNSAWEKALGYTREELLSRPYLDFVHPDDWERTIAEAQKIATGMVTTSFENRYRCKDGSYKWLLWNATPAPGRKLVYAIARDITEHKQLEVALQADRDQLETRVKERTAELGNKDEQLRVETSERARALESLRVKEARERAILESALDAIITIDHQGKIVEFNPAAEKMFGFARAGVLGKELAETIVPRSLRDRHRQGLAHYLATGEGPVLGKQIEMPALRADGSEFPVELAIARINLEGPPMFTAYLRDIAERRRTEKALRESEERYRFLFENNPQPMWVYDTGTLAFVAVNDTAVKRYGYSREEFLGMRITDIRPPEDIPAVRDSVAKTTSAVGETEKWRHRTKDGKVIYVEITSHTLPIDKGNSRLVVVNDVTERKQLEERFLQAQKMEAVGQLAGGVAHDFNNLLTIITGYSQLLLGRLGSADPMRGYAEEIKNAGDRAASLTRQLLAFSRKQVLRPQVLDLNVVVGSLEKMLRRLVGEDIEIKTALKSDLGHVKADAGQIEQVIMNLVVNARDAMPRGGKMTIETDNVELDNAYARARVAVTPGPYVMLAVSDTGIGMDADTQSHVFEPFFTTKEKDKGTGLGLATVYGIIKQSGGNIWVYSEPGRGATFKIYLPRVEEAVEATMSERAAQKLPRATQTVLLVEDEAAVRALVRNVLVSSGYTVLEATAGQEALQVSEQHQGPIHLLLTDVIMPGMGGRELTERLGSTRPEMKVVYMSGYTDDAIVHHGVLDAGTAFLQKPFTPDAVARMVRDVLGTCESNLTREAPADER